MSYPPARRLDEKLSRGLVRQEMRALDRDIEALIERLSEIMKSPVAKISRGQKITDRDLAALDAQFRSVLSDGTKYLEGYVVRDLRALQAKNHFAQSRMLHVIPNMTNTEFTLAAARFFIEPRRVVMAATRAPFSFSRHLAERMLQRRKSEITAKPVTTIGQVMARSTGLLGFAIRVANAFPERRLAIPFEEGLILGEVRDTTAGEMFDVTEITFEKGDTRVPVMIPIPFTPPSRGRHGSRHQLLEFSGRTFIGRGEMHPDQEALHTAWSDFTATHAEAVDFLAKMTLWPGLTAREHELLWKEHGAGKLPPLEEACEAAAEILCNPAFAKAMGNSSPPTEVPESFIRTAVRNRDMERGIFDDETEGLPIETGFRR